MHAYVYSAHVHSAHVHCVSDIFLCFKHRLNLKHFLLVCCELLDHLSHLVCFIAVRALSRIVLVNVIRPLYQDKEIKGECNSIKYNPSYT